MDFRIGISIDETLIRNLFKKIQNVVKLKYYQIFILNKDGDYRKKFPKHPAPIRR